jgi:alpha-glucan,water dikinase
MAVLVQRVVPARYAFVAHTTNPTTRDADEIFVELVAGLGEAIVSGAVPGSALAFAARKEGLEGGAGGDCVRVLAYPSKAAGYFVPDDSLIFRSDSNGEDLPGYAGAGLYDSITMDESVLRAVDYGGDALLTDARFREELMLKVARAAAAVEAACGGVAQDVEGCVDGEGNVYVVQTRPQV